MKNILIAYFSHAGENYVNGKIASLPIGNTEIVARKIAEFSGGCLFHIEQDEDYPADYYKLTEVAKQELQENARPGIKEPLPAISPYDCLVLGYPNWWGTMPMAVWTFLEAVETNGKKIAPFCTNEGSGMGRSEKDLRRLCHGAEILPGLAIIGHEAEKSDMAVKGWLRNLDII